MQWVTASPVVRWGMLAAVACASPGALPAVPADRTLAADVILEPEWTRITTWPPLTVQPALEELVLHHSQALTLTRAPSDEQNAVYCPTLLQSIVLDVELIAADGSVEVLAPGGISPGRLGMRAPLAEPGEERQVTSLRLRSSRRLDITRLEWRARAN